MVVLVGVVMAIFNDLSTARERTANARDCVVTKSQNHKITGVWGCVISVIKCDAVTEETERLRDRETERPQRPQRPQRPSEDTINHCPRPPFGPMVPMVSWSQKKTVTTVNPSSPAVICPFHHQKPLIFHFFCVYLQEFIACVRYNICPHA